jgi:hypothetical protein
MMLFLNVAPLRYKPPKLVVSEKQGSEKSTYEGLLDWYISNPIIDSISNIF